MTGGLATAVPASAAATPIDIVGISGGTVTPDSTTGYTLTLPGLTPSTSYRAAMGVAGREVGTATSTSTSAGLGTFVVTVAAALYPGTTVSVAAQPLSTATNFSNVSVTFGASTDTTPVAITGLTGATIAGDGTTGYAIVVPGLTPNTAYTVTDADLYLGNPGVAATSDGTGLVTFAIPGAETGVPGARLGVTLSLSSYSAPVGSLAYGTFVVPDAALVIAPADDTATVVAGEQVTTQVGANDVATTYGTAIPGTDLTYATLVAPTHGTATWNPDHSLVYTATTAGVDAFTYRVTDATSGIYGDATVTVTVAAAPVAPTAAVTAVNDTATTTADGAIPAVPVNIPVAANDTVTMSDGSAVDAASVTYTTVDQPTLGTATWNSDHSLTYAAGPVAGVDTFTYRVSYLGVSADATVTVTVDPAGVIVSDPITVAAVDDTATVVASSGATTIDVAANDSATQTGSPYPTADLTYTVLTEPTLGTASFNSEHGLVYTPGPVAGVDTFTYRAAGGGGSADATVTVTVTAAPAPVAVVTAVDDTATVAASITIDGTPATLDVAANDSATLAGDPMATADLTYTLLPGEPSGLGAASFNADHSLTYTPGGLAGVDTLTYQACYGSTCDTATVTVTITAAPVVVTAGDDTAVLVTSDSARLLAEANGGSDLRVQVSANDTATLAGADVPLTFTLLSAPAGVAATLGPDGVLSYLPRAFSSVDTFTYRACSGDTCATATVTVTVAYYNEPVAFMGTSVAMTLRTSALGGAFSPSALTYTANTAGLTGGTVTADPTHAGAFIYTADAQTVTFWGLRGESFGVQVCEPISGECGDAQVGATALSAYAAVAVDDATTVAAGRTTTVDVAANDTWPGFLRGGRWWGLADSAPPTRDTLGAARADRYADAIDAHPDWRVGQVAGLLCEDTAGTPVWFPGVTGLKSGGTPDLPAPCVADTGALLTAIPTDLTYVLSDPSRELTNTTYPPAASTSTATLGTATRDPAHPSHLVYVAGSAPGVDTISYRVCSRTYGTCSYAATTTVTVTSLPFVGPPLPKTGGDDQLLLLGGIGGLAAILAGAFLFGGRRRRADED